MENPEKLATQGTQDEEKQNKYTTQDVQDTSTHKQDVQDTSTHKQDVYDTSTHNTRCVGHKYTQTNTNKERF